MKVEDFYKQQEKRGWTQNITCNPKPDYDVEFFQEIFGVMERYAQHEKEELIQSILTVLGECFFGRHKQKSLIGKVLKSEKYMNEESTIRKAYFELKNKIKSLIN